MKQPQTPSIMDALQGDIGIEDSGYVAGIDIGGTNLRVALADNTGAVLAKWSSTTVGVSGADAVMVLIREGVELLLRQISAPHGALKAVAAGAPGITDVDAGIVIATSYLMGWRDVPLRAMLEDTLNAPAAVDNDVNLAAIGENWAGAAKGVRDFVFLAIGTGIGSGIVLNGCPFRGSNWAAGEIGYMLVPGVPDAPWNQGEPGALESMIGGEGIKAQWQRSAPEDTERHRDLRSCAGRGSVGEDHPHTIRTHVIARYLQHQPGAQLPPLCARRRRRHASGTLRCNPGGTGTAAYAGTAPPHTQ